MAQLSLSLQLHHPVYLLEGVLYLLGISEGMESNSTIFDDAKVTNNSVAKTYEKVEFYKDSEKFAIF